MISTNMHVPLLQLRGLQACTISSNDQETTWSYTCHMPGCRGGTTGGWSSIWWMVLGTRGSCSSGCQCHMPDPVLELRQHRIAHSAIQSVNPRKSGPCANARYAGLVHTGTHASTTILQATTPAPGTSFSPLGTACQSHRPGDTNSRVDCSDARLCLRTPDTQGRRADARAPHGL